MTPHEPPVGAAQTTPRLLQTCITAMARAAARVCRPPAATVPFSSARQMREALGRVRGMFTFRSSSPEATEAFITA